ncbi:MAG: tetratricopeptide repeat protein [Saprospiraceae bacterium]|nr:tetratricopeptide repeat protein [Saprospiraceae bacterium]
MNSIHGLTFNFLSFMRHLLIIFGILTFTATAFSQGFEEELGFKYVKAEYLLNTQRYDDAVKELNDIIKQNPEYKDALVMRGETKYKLAAYKGAKIDAMQAIELSGVTPTAASILGRSEYAMGNYDAALNSLTTAISLGLTDEKLFLERADIYVRKSMNAKACDDWKTAAKYGSTTAAINAKKNCGLDLPSSIVTAKPNVDDSTILTDNTQSGPSDSSMADTNNGVGQENSGTSTLLVQNTGEEIDSTVITENNTPTSYFPIPEENNTPNEIVIDEDLTLAIIGQGLGLRRVLERPSILILSDVEGVVAVEICVNENGRVEYSEYNAARSTIDTKSLVSLAVRKASEFWFERNDYPKQCGFIYFKIKGT